jgi:hypothetical protein
MADMAALAARSIRELAAVSLATKDGFDIVVIRV